MPWRARDFVHCWLRRRASRPQLKRDPLGGTRTTSMALSRSAFSLFLALAALNGPLAAQVSVRNGLRADIIGCYALFTRTGRRVDSGFYRASPLVRLDSALQPFLAAHKEFGARRLLKRLDSSGHHLDPGYPPRLGPMWWMDSLSDSVRLSFTDGFSGAFLALAAPHAGSDTLRGRIEEHWDYRDPTSQDAAYAVRVRCAE